MKNFLFAVIITLVVGLSVNCSANPYENDPNYQLVVSDINGIYYLYLPSLEVQEYNPPHYQIAVNFAFVSYYDGSTNSYKNVKRYNWYTKETFHQNEEGNWVKDEISHGNSLSEMRPRIIADAMFGAAYGINFYGY